MPLKAADFQDVMVRHGSLIKAKQKLPLASTPTTRHTPPNGAHDRADWGESPC
jgi:hypothetical protein